ncbi:MAG: hypothetical protein V4649_17200 [Bacteroidota bacterium]
MPSTSPAIASPLLRLPLPMPLAPNIMAGIAGQKSKIPAMPQHKAATPSQPRLQRGNNTSFTCTIAGVQFDTEAATIVVARSLLTQKPAAAGCTKPIVSSMKSSLYIFIVRLLKPIAATNMPLFNNLT